MRGGVSDGKETRAEGTLLSPVFVMLLRECLIREGPCEATKWEQLVDARLTAGLAGSGDTLRAAASNL